MIYVNAGTLQQPIFLSVLLNTTGHLLSAKNSLPARSFGRDKGDTSHLSTFWQARLHVAARPDRAGVWLAVE
jgi:hypothetical protein